VDPELALERRTATSPVVAIAAKSSSLRRDLLELLDQTLGCHEKGLRFGAFFDIVAGA
jgi:hypothetical protein